MSSKNQKTISYLFQNKHHFDIGIRFQFCISGQIWCTFASKKLTLTKWDLDFSFNLYLSNLSQFYKTLTKKIFLDCQWYLKRYHRLLSRWKGNAAFEIGPWFRTNPLSKASCRLSTHSFLWPQTWKRPLGIAIEGLMTVCRHYTIINLQKKIDIS